MMPTNRPRPSPLTCAELAGGARAGAAQRVSSRKPRRKGRAAARSAAVDPVSQASHAFAGSLAWPIATNAGPQRVGSPVVSSRIRAEAKLLRAEAKIAHKEDRTVDAIELLRLAEKEELRALKEASSPSVSATAAPEPEPTPTAAKEDGDDRGNS